MKSNKVATTKVDQLINECRKFIPLDGRVLVHALKLRQIKQEDYSFEVADTKANQGKDPEKHRVDLKKVQPKVNAKYQEAVVLQVPFDENRFKVGDKVIYPIGSINPFDLIKGVSVLRKYDIAAVVTDHEVELEDDRFAIQQLNPSSSDTTTVNGYTL